MKYLILGFSVAKFESVLNTEEKETILMLFWAGFSHIHFFFPAVLVKMLEWGEVK